MASKGSVSGNVAGMGITDAQMGGAGKPTATGQSNTLTPSVATGQDRASHPHHLKRAMGMKAVTPSLPKAGSVAPQPITGAARKPRPKVTP